MSKARGHLQNERLPNRSTGNRYSVEEQRASRKKEVLMKLRIRRRFQSLIDLNITALNIGTFLPWPRVLLFRQPPAKTYLNARQSNSPAFFMVSVGDKWDLFSSYRPMSGRLSAQGDTTKGARKTQTLRKSFRSANRTHAESILGLSVRENTLSCEILWWTRRCSLDGQDNVPLVSLTTFSG